jgi:hypothetical protein
LIYKCGGIDKRTIEKFEKVSVIHHPDIPLANYNIICPTTRFREKSFKVSTAPLTVTLIYPSSYLGGAAKNFFFFNALSPTLLNPVANGARQFIGLRQIQSTATSCRSCFNFMEHHG